MSPSDHQMRKGGALLSLALLLSFTLLPSCFAVATSSSAGNATVHVSNCTDRAFCMSGCFSVDLPAGQCMANDNTGSQFMTCDATLDVCGDLSYFTDSECTNLWMTYGFVCQHCNLDNHDNEYNMFKCDAKNGEQFINVLGQCDNTCGGCNKNFNLTVGACIPVSVKQALRTVPEWARRGVSSPPSDTILYAKYTGAVACEVVKITQWNQPSCAGAVAKKIALPQYSCMNGLRANCLY